MNSFNIAIAHLGEVYDHADSAVASGITSFFGSKGAAALNTARTAVSFELAKAYAGRQITEGEKKDMEELLDTQSPAKLKKNVQEVVQLLKGKLSSYNDQWQNAKLLQLSRISRFSLIVQPVCWKRLKERTPLLGERALSWRCCCSCCSWRARKRCSQDPSAAENILHISEQALEHFAENYPHLSKLADKLGYGAGVIGAYKLLKKLDIN